MSATDFEARYQAHPDPWGYTSSAYEREKYRATLAACGPGPFHAALELGSSIGVFSELLAPRCETLVTVDAAPSAVAVAGERLSGRPNATALLGLIPDAIPHRLYDLVVASEILYYLTPTGLTDTLAVLRERLISGGRLVAVHWRPPGSERPFSADQVHQRLRGQPWLTSTVSNGTDDYRLDVLERS
jgi:predicted TPR repeat methyltransferase